MMRKLDCLQQCAMQAFSSRGDDTPPTISKAELYQRKVMLSVWWDWKGVVFFELQPRNRTIGSIVYLRQLDSSNEAVIQKRQS